MKRESCEDVESVVSGAAEKTSPHQKAFPSGGRLFGAAASVPLRRTPHNRVGEPDPYGGDGHGTMPSAAPVSQAYGRVPNPPAVRPPPGAAYLLSFISYLLSLPSFRAGAGSKPARQASLLCEGSGFGAPEREAHRILMRSCLSACKPGPPGIRRTRRRRCRRRRR